MQRLIIGLIIVVFLVSNGYAGVEIWPARFKSITLENAGNEPKQLADYWNATYDECYYIAFLQNGKIRAWKNIPDDTIPVPSGVLVKVFSMQPTLLYMLPFDWSEHYPNLEDCEEAYWGLLRTDSEVEPHVSPFWIYCEADGDGKFSFITQMGREGLQALRPNMICCSILTRILQMVKVPLLWASHWNGKIKRNTVYITEQNI